MFDRFVARVFAVFGDRVIAKGGAVLELRLERARMTRDVDLRVTGDPHSILPLLERASAMETGDFLSFIVKRDPHHPAIGGDGVIYEGQRFRVEGRLARKIYGEPFGVDAAFGDVLLVPPDEILGTDFFAFLELPRTRLRVYPRSTHLAEKLHAYTLPRERENSRVKDLPDMALLATTGPFDAGALRDAINATFAFRKTHDVPTALPAPPPSWRAVYARMAAQDQLAWGDIDALTVAVRAFLDPILDGRTGTWDATTWAWR